jgi:hypothetical protein
LFRPIQRVLHLKFGEQAAAAQESAAVCGEYRDKVVLMLKKQ